MRKVVAVMFMTLDGVAEFPVYPPETGAAADEEEDPMWTPRMDSIDTLLLGRVAYTKWYAYWPARKRDPDSNDFQKSFAAFADRAEKLVFSTTLKKVEWPHSRIVSGDAGKEIARLKSLPGKDIALGGGPRLLQSFLAQGLVDELVIAMFPSVVGKGKPFFHVVSNPENPEDRVPLGAPGRQDFELVESKPMNDGTLFLHYRKRPAEKGEAPRAPRKNR